METQDGKTATRRNYGLDVMLALFGMSSWISVNGLWVELPLIVDKLPEYYDVASYLSVIIQMANVGPIAYGLAVTLFPERVKQSHVIYLLLFIG